MIAPISFLAGDLGGTKTLLAIYSWDGQQLNQKHQRRYESAEWSSFEPMLRDFLGDLPTGMQKPQQGCIAVAGQVRAGDVQITNLSWQLNEKKLCEEAGLKQLELINDFGVLIYGLPHLKPEQQVVLQADQLDNREHGPLAIVGAGTGLGMAHGIQTQAGLLACSSEGGHCEFAPRNQKEWQLRQWLKNDLNLQRLSLERIVSGTGLGHVVHWRLQQDDAQGHPLCELAEAWRQSPDNIPDLPALASQAADAGDPLIQEAEQLWLSAYGSAAGDFALQTLCTGGLWIGGGTAAKQIKGLRSNTFLEALHNKGRFRPFLEQLPVMALIDPEAGLFSAACRARMLADPGSGTLA
ncbi:MAG: Glucokinase [Prochlorococcus marinus str. MIT 9215]|nr:MAG: Glucokinase [Prochlorococcus marinus str. MIT 9215]